MPILIFSPIYFFLRHPLPKKKKERSSSSVAKGLLKLDQIYFLNRYSIPIRVLMYFNTKNIKKKESVDKGLLELDQIYFLDIR